MARRKAKGTANGWKSEEGPQEGVPLFPDDGRGIRFADVVGGGIAEACAKARVVNEALELRGEGIRAGCGEKAGSVVLDKAIDAGRIGKPHAGESAPHGLGKGQTEPFDAGGIGADAGAEEGGAGIVQQSGKSTRSAIPRSWARWRRRRSHSGVPAP